MRTTVDLSEQVYEHARNLAHLRRRSLSQTLAELIERGMAQLAEPELREDPMTGLTVMHFGEGTITHEDVRSLEDEQ